MKPDFMHSSELRKHHEKVDKIHIFFDGACHNKGVEVSPMGIGVYSRISRTEEITIAEYKGFGTSNIAEWCALIRALELCLELRDLPNALNFTRQFVLHGDSQLIVNQFNEVYRVKQNHFIPYFRRADHLRTMLGTALRSVNWIRREYNEQADELSKEGLNKAKNSIK